MRFGSGFVAVIAVCACAPAVAEQGQSNQAATPLARTIVVEMKDGQGNFAGTVQIRPTANGTLFTANLMNLPPGGHGFHVHERGQCDPPDFKSAGAHYNPDNSEHGLFPAKGPHAGDLPNVYVAANGVAIAEFHTDRLILEPGAPVAGVGGGPQTTGSAAGAAAGPFPLLDADGSAVIVHANPDDYSDVNSAGNRIACGVISRQR